MDCPRGMLCRERTHTVTTIKGAYDWFNGILESDLPIVVNQVEGAGGRLQIKIFNKHNRLIYAKG